MIARNQRFHGRSSIGAVFRRGKTVRGEFISVRYSPSKYDDFRAAIVVSKKVSKSAVVRNRIRRRIYEILRTERAVSAQAWRYDLIISVYDERVATMPHDQLLKTMRNLLEKAGV